MKDNGQSSAGLGRVMTHATMEREKRPAIVKKPDVLKKFNAESLLMIERGLLGDLPEKLRPQPFISRARPDDLQIAKPSSFLSSCLPVTESPSPVSDRVTFEYGDENISPLKKSFSFREKLTRMSFFGRDKDKKWKTGDDEKDVQIGSDLKRGSRIDDKSHKRFWFNRHKENSNKARTPIYQRSKSFEFLPRAIEEEEEIKSKKLNRQSSIYEESMGDAWTSNDSLEYISNVYYDKEDGVFLKSIREFPSESSSLTNNHSSISTVTSASSANAVENIFKTTSVMNLLDEFDKAVDLFSESYLSDCEPYTKSSKQIPKAEKRKSFSFSNIPSPKVLHVTKVDEISEEFKQELSRALRVKPRAPEGGRGPRRGSVTDWFVLEDQASEKRCVSEMKSASEVKSEMNRYRRGQQKPMNRVRRMSSTKYVSVFLILILYLSFRFDEFS